MHIAPRTYEESFHQWTPFYARQWTVRSSMERLLAAQADILDTLKSWSGERTPYTGKLYAELDVIRGVIHAKREPAKRARRYSMAALQADMDRLVEARDNEFAQLDQEDALRR